MTSGGLSKRPKTGKRKGAPRKPFAPLYALVCVLVRPYLRLVCNARIDRRAIKGIKGPVLVLCNHQSNLDFLLAATTAFPLRLNVMVTTWFYNSALLRKLLNLLGAIPKKQFAPDSSAIKAALKVAARGGSIGIFPEGQVCYSGKNNDIDESIGKLIKKLGLTTLNFRIRGNHLTCPKWAGGKTYRGRVECTAEVLFWAEELGQMPLEEVTARTMAALSYNEYEWQREKRIPFRPRTRTAEGLDVVLHWCPACGAEFAMRANGGRLYCSRCGYAAELDAYGFFARTGDTLIFDNPAAWYTAQQAQVEKELDNGALPFRCRATFFKSVDGQHGLAPCGEGEVVLDDTGLHYTGSCDGKAHTLSTLYERQSHLAHAASQWILELHGEDGSFYGVRPDDIHKTVWIIDAYAAARKRKLSPRR